MTHSITTTIRPASDTKLAHTEMACTCGLVWGTTMESQVSIDTYKHLEYHSREGR